MSRPFSYSDENFNVIGNVLFCHIRIKKRIYSGQPIVYIPPEIYDRMLVRSNRLSKLATGINSTSISNVDVGVKLNDNKCFLYSKNDISDTGMYLVGFYILKDI